jgi:cell division protein FtsQ
VEVEGVTRARGDDLLERAGIVIGDPWIGLPIDEIEFRVEGHPWVRQVRVRRPWPGVVKLRVTERVPLARYRVKGVDFGVSDDLRMLPQLAAADSLLPELSGDLDDVVLARGLKYAEALRQAGLAGTEPLELRLSAGSPDRIVLPRRGFSARIEEAVPPADAVRNVAAFLETLDEEGEVRGTLRLISVETAVWEAAA